MQAIASAYYLIINLNQLIKKKKKSNYMHHVLSATDQTRGKQLIMINK